MKKQAIKLDSVVTGSLIIEEQDNYFNRLIWAQPDGEIYTYDKHHLFRMAGEHNHFKAGEERLIVTYKGWRICPLICYDLRFPVWSRNTFLNLAERSRCVVKGEDKSVYDLLIYVANWPQVRKQAWSKLLEARAIENQCFVVGVNRVGEDGNGKGYSGNSVVVAPRGEVISNIIDNTDITESIELSMEELTDVRKKFPVSLDGDEFIL